MYLYTTITLLLTASIFTLRDIFGEEECQVTLMASLRFVSFGYINHNKPTTALNKAMVNLIVHCWVEMMLSIGTTTKTNELNSHLTGWH
jgi:hypothetical protein